MTSKAMTRTRLLGTTVLAGVGLVLASAPAFAQDQLETVTVTGYRASLAESTSAKRESVNFQDSVFAQDIGKFPDTNIAEAFNRIPGVTINRENDGSGMRIAIRGLDTNHVKITLNGATVQTASTGNTDAGGANREVDLNIFPIELFTQLTVDKTAKADQLEGGAAGNVNMRSARPFDNPGTHFSYNMQATDYARNGNPGGRGTLIASTTQGKFGVLVGLSGAWNRVMITGYEGAFNSLTVPSLSDVQYYTQKQITAFEAAAGVAPGAYPAGKTSWCTTSNATSPNTTSTAPVSTCNPIGGQNGWNPPKVFPNTGVPAAYVGKTVTGDALLALNPGLTQNQIASAIVPRTGRPMFEKGTRNRYNGILSFEYRPTDAMHFYLDSIFGVLENNLNREDLMWGARSGAAIPMNMQVDKNNVVTYGDMANAYMTLEARPYKEKSDYISLNPGMDWQVSDLLNVKAQVNYSRAHFFRDSPSFLFSTPNAIVHYDNTGATPTFSMSGLSGANGLQDPTNYGWYSTSALRLQQERRSEFTDGAHLDVSYGGDEFSVQGGFAFDDQYRLIRGYDNGGLFGEAGCNLNPTTYIPGPNKTFSCAATPDAIPGDWTKWWGVTDINGNGYTKGMAFPKAQGPLLPNSAIPQYLSPGPNGFVNVNYDGLKTATNYQYYATTPPPGAPANLQDPGRTGFSTGTNTNISSSIIDEKTTGLYFMINGTLHRGEQKLKYNIGARWARTIQTVTGYTSAVDPRNTWTIDCANPTYASLVPLDANKNPTCTTGTINVAAPDGTRYPNSVVPTTAKSTYEAFLPSVNLVWEVFDDFQIRGAVSRTMTRANPANMLPSLGGGGSGGDAFSLGNPNLRPFYSTNIDLGANLFTGGEGYFGVGIFKKMVTGFPSNYTSYQKYPWLAQYGTVFANNAVGSSQYINLVNLATAGGCWDPAKGSANTLDCVNVQVTQARNASGLETIKGVELNWVQPLDFYLEQFGMKGFGFTANATFVSTKTTPNSAAPSVVLGVSPMTMNLTAYYENDGIMLRGSYSYQRGTIVGSNAYGIIAGIPSFTEERSMDYGQVDISSSVKLSKFFGEIPTDPELTFDVQNLTHALNGRSYKQYPNLMNYSYRPGSLFLLGVRGSL
ncbi:TonB-dependent receptor [Rhizomicrobium palustre]|uniref:TonB-dependent receptor n=1 Tax=Rhizomicrobium palustre TaxID=189966 RepID=A0A846MYZ5_9PROT|nr:TonB-dependent receptor [Rhizomicrobium palustre]NIK88445.1 TonB-dependent receptor [Rhizomicrobium palustre]